jgi:DNA repair protein RecN (Recombination protein N)
LLKTLKIENYAIIEKLEINFSKGFSVITGETGAGKSILVGALSLILGQRADTKILFDKKKKCFVEGTFNIKSYGLSSFFEACELDYDENTILRREINPEGKSRAFINDTPVNLYVLKELAEKLIDIHSQHKTITLNESSFQLAVLDSYAKNINILKQYRQEYIKYMQLKSELKDLTEKELQANKDKDYYQFLFDEIEKAGISEDEQKNLEKEIEVLNNSELIKKNLSQSVDLLDNSENNLISHLNEILNYLQKIQDFHPAISDLTKRLESCRIDIKDVSKELELIEKNILYSPLKIEEINDRLSLIYNLEQKHRVSNTAELLRIKDSISEKLYNISSLKEQIENISKELNDKYKFLLKFAESLSSERKKHIPKIEKDILHLSEQLGMPDAKFKIIQEQLNDFNQTGKDKITYFFNANKGGELKELSKVASGGELSRLMLSIKSVITQRNLLPTIIFDEIDIGVSGDIASKVGNIILNMSKQMQVIAITHQPQIAAKGDMHYLVFKTSDKKTTHTYVKKLNDVERIEEITKMISGIKTSRPATETAKEMLNSN